MKTHERSAPASRHQPRCRPITGSHRYRAKGPSRTDSRILRDRAIVPLHDILGNALANLRYETPSMVRAPCLPASRRQDHDRGNRGGSGLRDLPAMVVDGDVHVVAFPCRKRNMAGRPVICPATLDNVNCLGRFVQPGGAAAYLLLYRLRNSNEPIRWASMCASASSSGRSLMRRSGCRDRSTRG